MLGDSSELSAKSSGLWHPAHRKIRGKIVAEKYLFSCAIAIPNRGRCILSAAFEKIEEASNAFELLAYVYVEGQR